MRAILIDPVARTITEVEFNGDYKHIYTLLSDPENGLEVDDFNVVDLTANRDETLFVDGEGLLKRKEWFFVWAGYHQPLAGRGLILGLDEAGDSIATKLSLEFVKRNVAFLKLAVEGFKTSTGKQELFGKDFTVIRSEPIFGPPQEE